MEDSTPQPATGTWQIARERQRQGQQEGYSPEHDDRHDQGELVRAAICYASPPLGSGWGDDVPYLWPFEAVTWKPKDQISNLVRAGALISAEIDRLQRKATRDGSS